MRVDLPAELAACVVALCWLSFGVTLMVGKRGAERATKVRDDRSHAGFLLQCLGYAVCFAYYRPFFSPFLPMSKAAEDISAGFAILVAVASAWLCFAAARALGRHWALVARVIEGHTLIRSGPYAVVRHPIYLAMFGMLVATGLAISRWEALAIASVLFLMGTAIRVRSEELLLRRVLGDQFEQYAKQVPPLIPRAF